MHIGLKIACLRKKSNQKQMKTRKMEEGGKEPENADSEANNLFQDGFSLKFQLK